MTRVVRLDELPGLVGQELGVSRWHELTQATVDQFAAATGDHQWIHVDPRRAAAESPWGAPVAHGLLTLGLLPSMITDAVTVDGVDVIVNKGFDKVRLANPVLVGARVRGAVRLASARQRPRGFHEVGLTVTVEVDGQPGTALKAETIFLYHQAAVLAPGCEGAHA
ncbi:MaoC family dehydratase [Actinokineospora iranica]|uniref:Acyl dehydratase n=1 Tax=Actinokineospora iranica TaxID=1271860 RepID=A0A1G6SPW4_9PSEU|nr:MaoC family dehydratase [Actinokineospora iranica]SDD18843.1 Acyl dehydratase [Actinokineospora iranica]